MNQKPRDAGDQIFTNLYLVMMVACQASANDRISKADALYVVDLQSLQQDY